MDDHIDSDRSRSQRPSGGTTGTPRGAAPYRRAVPHITQEPITDESLTASTPPSRGHAPAPQTGGGTRRHMGVATSDPQYLPVTEPEGWQERARRHPVEHRAEHADEAPHHSVDYSRYLSTPKPGKSIFMSQHDRERIRMKRFLMVALIVLIVAFALWFVFIR